MARQTDRKANEPCDKDNGFAQGHTIYVLNFRQAANLVALFRCSVCARQPDERSELELELELGRRCNPLLKPPF